MKGQRLQAQNKTASLEDIQDTGQLLQKLAQVSSFKCQVTGLMQLHNYLAYVRETKSAQKLLIYDISNPSSLKVQDEDIVKPINETD